MANPFEQIRANSNDQSKSFSWYMNQVRNVARGINNPSTAMSSSIAKRQTIYDIGEMYLFRYDAKHKNKLPYFDAFPLCLPFEPTNDGFWGMNLHYLPYMLRAQLLGKLLETLDDKELTSQSQMRYSWELLSSAARFPEVKPCVKRYLTTQMRSSFYWIDPLDWKAAIFLPVEDFNTSKSSVFSDSRGMM